LIFDVVFVSRDFELGRNVSCEESTVSPVQGEFLLYKYESSDLCWGMKTAV